MVIAVQGIVSQKAQLNLFLQIFYVILLDCLILSSGVCNSMLCACLLSSELKLHLQKVMILVFFAYFSCFILISGLSFCPHKFVFLCSVT